MAMKKKTGRVSTAARQRGSRQAGRTIMRARSGTRRKKRLSASTRPALKVIAGGKPPTGKIIRRRVLTVREKELLAVTGGQTTTKTTTTRCRSESRDECAVVGPFYSQAHDAWRVEYNDCDSTGAWWESSFYCEDEADAKRLARAAHKVKGRADWIGLHREAREIAAEGGNGFLYRIMLGERSEVFRKARDSRDISDSSR